MQVSAHNVANLGTDNFRRQELLPTTNRSGGVATSIRQAAQPGNAIETDLVNQLQAKNAFLANLAVFRANDRMAGSLLDAVG